MVLIVIITNKIWIAEIVQIEHGGILENAYVSLLPCLILIEHSTVCVIPEYRWPVLSPSIKQLSMLKQTLICLLRSYSVLHCCLHYLLTSHAPPPQPVGTTGGG